MHALHAQHIYIYIIFAKGGNSFNRVHFLVDIYNKFKRKILPQNHHKTSKKNRAKQTLTTNEQYSLQNILKNK